MPSMNFPCAAGLNLAAAGASISNAGGLSDRLLFFYIASIVATAMIITAISLVLINGLKRQFKAKEVALNEEIQERQKREARISHLNRSLEAIRNVNRLITQEHDSARLLKKTCRNLTKTRGYYNAWIAHLDEGKRLIGAYESGLGNDFLPMIELMEEGKFTRCGRRALEKSGATATDSPLEYCTDCPLSKNYSGRGGITVRLEHAGRIFGLLSVSIPAHFLHDAEEQSLVEGVVRDLAFALHNIRLANQHHSMQKTLKLASSIINGSPVVLFRWRAEKDWPVEFVSGNIRRFGYTTEELLSGRLTYASIIHPGDIEIVFREAGVKAENRINRFEQEYRIIDSEGRIRWVKDRKVAIYEAKSIVAYQGTVIDVTEMKKTDDELRQNEKLFRKMVENAAVWIWMVDSQGVFVYVGPHADQFTGCSPGELLGKRPCAFMKPEAAERSRRAFSRLEKEKRPIYSFKTEIMSASGREMSLETEVAPLFEEAGDFSGCVGLSRFAVEI